MLIWFSLFGFDPLYPSRITFFPFSFSLSFSAVLYYKALTFTYNFALSSLSLSFSTLRSSTLRFYAELSCHDW